MKPFLRTVCALRSLWEEGDHNAHTRIFDILIRDKYAYRYESEQYLSRKGSFTKGETRREHAVPCKMIRDYCLKMFAEGAKDEDVAQLIKQHLRIVHITKAECDRLDKMGLRFTMPDGWQPGNDQMARIEIASIAVEPIEPATHY